MDMRMRAPSLAHREDERGYTLIELMVVVLIIGILIAIALPTYLGAKQRAADRAIQTNMRTGLAAAVAYYSEEANWDGFDATQAKTEEASLAWIDGGPPAIGQIAIVVHAGQELLLVGKSASSAFFCLAQLATSPATDRGHGTLFTNVDTTAECTNGW